MGGKPASILSFGIKGGSAAGAKFIDALQLILRLVNIGDAKSLACHPASTTHRQLSPAELATAGVGEDMVRRSEEHTSELQSLMRISYAVFCLKKKKKNRTNKKHDT